MFFFKRSSGISAVVLASPPVISVRRGLIFVHISPPISGDGSVLKPTRVSMKPDEAAILCSGASFDISFLRAGRSKVRLIPMNICTASRSQNPVVRP